MAFFDLGQPFIHGKHIDGINPFTMNIIFAIPRQLLGIVCLVTCTLSVAQVHFDIQSIESVGDEYFLSDFNGDGGIDLITRDGPAVYMALGSFSGEFGEPWQILDLSLELEANDYERKLRTGDYNGDGMQDLYIFSYWGAYHYIINENGDFGTGILSDQEGFGVGCCPSKLFVTDVSGDARSEIIGVRETSLGGDEYYSYWHTHLGVKDVEGDYFNANYNFFNQSGPYEFNPPPFWVHDLNNDGREDIIGWGDEIIIGGDSLESSIVPYMNMHEALPCFVQIDGTGSDEIVLLKETESILWLDDNLESIDSISLSDIPNFEFAEASNFEQSSISEEMLFYEDSLLMIAHFKTNGTVDFIDTIDSGYFSDLKILDMDHDGDMDFAIYKNGELNWYKNAEILAISETADVQFEVYPNPASGLLKVESSEPIDAIRLFSQEGLQVLENQNSKELLIEDLKPSMYIMEVQFENGSVSRKKIFKN